MVLVRVKDRFRKYIRRWLRIWPPMHLTATYVYGTARIIRRGPNPHHALACFPNGRAARPYDIEKILENLSLAGGCTFVQIGSNDGFRNDPLHKHIVSSGSWRGLLVEPVPFLFEQLKKTYSSCDGLIFENCVVSKDAREAFFYSIRPDILRELPDIPEWQNGLGSLRRGHAIHHFGAEIIPHIIVTPVVTTPLMTLLTKHDLLNLDLLHTDTEGHDYTIMASLDLRLVCPRYLMFEYNHMTFLQCAMLMHKLSSAYDFIYTDADILAIKRS